MYEMGDGPMDDERWTMDDGCGVHMVDGRWGLFWLFLLVSQLSGIVIISKVR